MLHRLAAPGLWRLAFLATSTSTRLLSNAPSLATCPSAASLAAAATSSGRIASGQASSKTTTSHASSSSSSSSRASSDGCLAAAASHGLFSSATAAAFSSGVSSAGTQQLDNSSTPPSSPPPPPPAPAPPPPAAAASDGMARNLVRGTRVLPLYGLKQMPPATPPPTPAGGADAGAAPGSSSSSRHRTTPAPKQQGNRQAQQGLLQLTGTEEQLFAQALEYVPPQAAAELAQVAQMATRPKDARHVPTHKLLQAISRVLDLSQQFPELHLAPLLQPVIAAAKTRYSLDALLPKVKCMRRVLPDTQLREALLSRDPADVSRTVSGAFDAFMELLAMQHPPVQLLSAPRAFVRLLTLPPAQLRLHLQLLREAVSSVQLAQQLARRYTGALLVPAAAQLLGSAGQVAALLRLHQDQAVELLLRYPYLASTPQQLQHLSALVQDLPQLTGIEQAQLQAVLVKRPTLARYSSPEVLAGRVAALRPLFPGVSADQLLELCSHAKIMRGSSSLTSVAASLRTCAAIMGHDSIAPLLPLLLQLTPPAAQQASEEEGDDAGALAAAAAFDIATAGAAKHPHAYLLQPAEKLASRAVQLQKLYGLSRLQLSRLARQSPRLVFAYSHATTKLKALLLQLQLLGDGSNVADDRLAPEVERMFRRCPRLANMRHQTVVDRLSHLQQLLDLSAAEASQLALKGPHLLIYTPDKVRSLFSGLCRLLGGQQQAQQLVVKAPQVLMQFSRLQAADGQLSVVCALQQLMPAPPDTTQQQQQQQAAPASQAGTGAGVQADAVELRQWAGQALMRDEVQSAAAAVEQQGLSRLHYAGVRAPRGGSLKWEMRHAGRSLYFATQAEAACAYDLAVLAAGRRPRGGGRFNFPAGMYNSGQVQAMVQHMQEVGKKQQGKQRAGRQEVQDRPGVQQQQQQQQKQFQQQQQGTQAVELAQPGVSQAAAAADGTEQAQSAAMSTATCQAQWVLARQLLLCAAGRRLLDMSPDAAISRLQALAGLTGSPLQQLLQRLLAGASHHPASLLSSSPDRLQHSAGLLQQLLQLSQADLQGLLRRAPGLLSYKADSLADKVALLVPGFHACWQAAGCGRATGWGSYGAEGDLSPDGGSTGVWAPHYSSGREGFACLQQAVLHTPEVLLLSADSLLQRLQALAALAEVETQGAGRQLRGVLADGAVGRWLTAGPAHYQHLKQLTATRSPQLQQLKLAQFFRQPRALLEQQPAAEGL